MKIFLSYRRDDTAGRAGRLYDMLANRFGPRNVFQDVATIEPGKEFMQRVADAIADSDVALVVIGSEWLTVTGPDGSRRLDDHDDYVRSEVSAALAAGLPVVPVLVGDAALPTAEELPVELRPLVQRQAARLRDDSWHVDVDALVRRLEGETAIPTPRRRWPIVAAVVVLVAAAVVVVALLRDRGGDGGDDDGGNDGGDQAAAVPACTRPDESWESIDLTTSEPAETTDGAGRSFRLSADAADYQTHEDASAVIVAQLMLENTTATSTGSDGSFYVEASDISALEVDGVSIGAPTCFSVLGTDPSVQPGGAATFLIGFTGAYDPAAALVIRTGIGAMDLQLTAGG